MRRRTWRPLAMCLMFVGLAALIAIADDPRSPAKSTAPNTPGPSAARLPGKPKELGESVTRGLKYLIAQQHENGGFGQGGGWRTTGEGRRDRVEGADVKDPPDVGNTCIAALALIRAGNSTETGPYAKQLAKALEFVENRVEEADRESLYVTPIRDTQLQTKIGQYVDTFLAALVLSELKGQMPDRKSEERLLAALNKTIGKIEANQQEDGTFVGNAGWAGVLSQAICSKAVNRAYQKGAQVRTDTIQKDLDQSVAQLAPGKTEIAARDAKPTATAARAAAAPAGVGKPRGLAPMATAGASGSGKGDAGVSLYSLSANAGRVQDAVNSNGRKAAEAKAVLESPTSDEKAKSRAQRELREIADSGEANRQALTQIAVNIGDKRFVKGFGNNGGEEFLSYMNISETLFVQGGEEWRKWDRQVCELITSVQNEDGSWSGHHCITGRTFCTSAALLTMMADRAPLPSAEAARPQAR